MKRIAAALVGMLLAGCATHAPKPNEIRPVPSDRALAFQEVTGGDATLVVTRDKGFMGSGCFLAVYIDGKEAARLDTGEKAIFHVPAGHHVLGTWNAGKALCGYREGKDRREADASLNPGETRKFRILIDGGGLKLEPTSL
jgi:hypothetical protein